MCCAEPLASVFVMIIGYRPQGARGTTNLHNYIHARKGYGVQMLGKHIRLLRELLWLLWEASWLPWEAAAL